MMGGGVRLLPLLILLLLLLCGFPSGHAPVDPPPAAPAPVVLDILPPSAVFRNTSAARTYSSEKWFALS